MNSAVNFIFESGVSLSLLAVIYILFLRNETFFRTNRLFLLGTVLFSVILPFLKFRIFAPQPVVLSEITVTPYRNLIEVVTVYSNDISTNVERAILSLDLLIFAYVAGFLFFFWRFIFRLTQVIFMIVKNPVRKMQGFKLVSTEKDISPFSFVDYVFVYQSHKKDIDYERMLLHELEHVKQGHSFDVIILELLTVFQWFNPFMWWLSRSIRENHEYLADQAVLISGVNRGYYKKLLLEQFSAGQLVIANNFNYSLIKKRIKMMSKIKSSKIAITKIAFGVFVAAALIIAFACEQKESFVNDPVSDSSLKLTLINDQIKIEGGADEIIKLKKIFSSGSGFEITTDSLGNSYLAKSASLKKPYAIELLSVTDDKNDEKHKGDKASGVKGKTTDDQVFFVVEDMPEFPGGEIELRTYIANHINYPPEAKEQGIQGKVYVSFTVTKTGGIADATIARGVDASLDKEALRVINSLPKWQPGKQRGQVVNVQYTVPINFKLQ